MADLQAKRTRSSSRVISSAILSWRGAVSSIKTDGLGIGIDVEAGAGRGRCRSARAPADRIDDNGVGSAIVLEEVFDACRHVRNTSVLGGRYH